MSILELAENLILVLTKLDTEHGIAQPQLVDPNCLSHLEVVDQDGHSLQGVINCDIPM